MESFMEIKNILEDLTNARGVSGGERGAAEAAAKYLSEICDETSVDKMGSVIGKIKGRSGKRRIMLEAHIDQVGFLVTEIDENGCLSFGAVGGIDKRILPGLRVRILAEKSVLSGVILSPQKVQDKTPDIKDLKIFTGLDEKQAKEQIRLGDLIVYDYELTELLSDNLCSGAMDNRAGMTALILAAEKISKNRPEDDIYIVFSTQEELGLRGAYTAAHVVDPDLAIVVDVTHGATEDSKDSPAVFELGCGAVVLRGPSVDYEKSLRLIKAAEEYNIPHEIEVAGGASGTTAWAIQTAGSGVPAVLISIPLRYMHTNVEVLNTNDIAAAAELVYRGTEVL